jgi:hypothetical protein
MKGRAWVVLWSVVTLVGISGAAWTAGRWGGRVLTEAQDIPQRAEALVQWRAVQGFGATTPVADLVRWHNRAAGDTTHPEVREAYHAARARVATLLEGACRDTVGSPLIRLDACRAIAPATISALGDTTVPPLLAAVRPALLARVASYLEAGATPTRLIAAIQVLESAERAGVPLRTLDAPLGPRWRREWHQLLRWADTAAVDAPLPPAASRYLSADTLLSASRGGDRPWRPIQVRGDTLHLEILLEEGERGGDAARLRVLREWRPWWRLVGVKWVTLSTEAGLRVLPLGPPPAAGVGEQGTGTPPS